jgi:DNA-directed RNA polymerase subunit F
MKVYVVEENFNIGEYEANDLLTMDGKKYIEYQEGKKIILLFLDQGQVFSSKEQALEHIRYTGVKRIEQAKKEIKEIKAALEKHNIDWRF